MTEKMSLEQYKAQKTKKGNKYGAEGTRCDGYYFDSKAELKYYHQLVLRKKAGDIVDFEVHPVYELFVNRQLICKAEFDFKVIFNQATLGRFAAPVTLGEAFELIDVKGADTEVSKLKRKLFEAIYGRPIILIVGGKRVEKSI